MEEKLKPIQLETPQELEHEARQRVELIQKEIIGGIKCAQKYPKSVTVLGSARFTEENEYYQKAQQIAGKIALLGYAVITGGGGGIMEAANRGAFESAGANSVGFNIQLPEEQKANPYITDMFEFHYFFTRKVALFFSAEVYLFFPGGFGTMDEFFELITLMQTKKIPHVPVVLVGSEYWNTLEHFIQKELVRHHGTVSPDDTRLYRILDDDDEIIQVARSARRRDE